MKLKRRNAKLRKRLDRLEQSLAIALESRDHWREIAGGSGIPELVNAQIATETRLAHCQKEVNDLRTERGRLIERLKDPSNPSEPPWLSEAAAELRPVDRRTGEWVPSDSVTPGSQAPRPQRLIHHPTGDETAVEVESPEDRRIREWVEALEPTMDPWQLQRAYLAWAYPYGRLPPEGNPIGEHCAAIAARCFGISY